MAPIIYGALSIWAMVLTVKIIQNAVLSGPRNLNILVNSDNLLPAQWAWDVHHNWHAWTQFEWPRVPSLVPDMVYFWGAAQAGMTWRQAFLGYSWVIVATFTGAIGVAAYCLQKQPRRSLGASLFMASLIPFSLVIACAFGQTVGGILSWKDLLSGLTPITHGDGMVFALLATAAAAQASEGGRIAKRLAIVFCAVGTYCDLVFLFEFLLPFILVERWPRLGHARASIARTGPSHWLRSPTARREVCEALLTRSILIRDLTIASACGWGLTKLLFRQNDPIDLKGPFTTLPLLFKDLTFAPWTGATVVAAAMLLLYVWKASGRMPVSGPAPHAASRRQLMLGTAACSALFGLAMLIPLYGETYNWRYAIAAQIWPATVLAATLAANRRHVVRIGLGCLTLFSIQSAFAAELRRSPGLLQWHSNVEMCLSAVGKHHHLAAGMATYWNARQTEASSDWHQQILLIDDLGRRRLWGNDVWYFTHDMANINLPAHFNFIIIDKAMRVPQIVKRYGHPGSVYACQDDTIWVYDHDLVPVVNS